jgi:hypothetical protein
MERDGELEDASRAAASGCRYEGRCGRGELACAQNDPELRDAGGGHLVACLKPGKNDQGG